MISAAAAVLVACGGGGGGGAANTKPQALDYTLANGLTVVVRSVPDAKQVAIVVLFGIGGDQDPPNKSGLAHLVEHVYVTAAAGGRKARRAEELMAAYPAGWNAQTGDRYTVVATVVTPDRVDAELAEAAARMSALDVVPADLDRERPRLVAEVENMFGGVGSLAAHNQARERVRPSLEGARRGGVPSQVATIDVAELTDRWKRYYKPRNAVVVVAGAVELEAGRAAIDKAFAAVPGGELAPAAAESTVRARLGELDVIELGHKTPAPELCAAWRVPAPTDPAYPAFLVLFGRMSGRASQLRGGKLEWAVFDDPEVLTIGAPLRGNESAEGALAAIDGFVKREARAAGGGRELVEHLVFGDDMARYNLYGWAFTQGRWRQLGLDRDKLHAAFAAVTDAQVTAAASVLSPVRRATVVAR